MTDAQDLARRYLDLWQDYLAALLADLSEPELARRWIAVCSALAANSRPRDAAEVKQARRPRSSVGTASAAGAAGERDDVVAEFARRLALVEDRLAVLERREHAATRALSGNRRSRV